MKNIEKSFKISVDTGQVVAILSHKKEKKSIPIKKGKYKITLSVKNSWRGPQTNFDYLDVKEDQFLAVDDSGLAYEMFDGKEPKSLHKLGCFLSTGGDGQFLIKVQLTPVSSIRSNPHEAKLKEAKKFFKKNKYNDETSETFVNKFLLNCHSSEIEAIVNNEHRKDMRKMLAAGKRLLEKIRNGK